MVCSTEAECKHHRCRERATLKHFPVHRWCLCRTASKRVELGAMHLWNTWTCHTASNSFILGYRGLSAPCIQRHRREMQASMHIRTGFDHKVCGESNFGTRMVTCAWVRDFAKVHLGEFNLIVLCALLAKSLNHRRLWRIGDHKGAQTRQMVWMGTERQHFTWVTNISRFGVSHVSQ